MLAKSSQKMSVKMTDSERDRLLRPSQSSPVDSAINDGNEFIISDLEGKTKQLLHLTRNVKNNLDADEEMRLSLSDAILRGGDLVSRSNSLLSNVTNDPSAFGVFKIAMLVFTGLCTVYFGGKFVFKFFTQS